MGTEEERWKPRQRARDSSRSSASCSTRRASSPPEEFRERALVTDESIHEEAARDPAGLVAGAAAELDWFTEPTEALDDSEPAVLQVVRRRQAERVVQLPRPPRRGRQRRPGRLPLARRGGRGARRHLRRPAAATSSGSPTLLKDRGVEAGDVVGIYLPMIPEVAVAMLACARIGAPHNVVFGGFSPDAVKERMQFSEAKALITVDARAAQGQDGRDQAGGRRVPRRGAVDRDRGRGPQHRRRRRDDRRARRLLRRGDRGRRRRVPAGRARRRAPAVHPLHLRLDGEAEGDPPHDRRLPDRGRLDAPSTSSTSSPTRTSSGARPTSAGSPATPTSSTGRCSTARRRSCTRARPTIPTRTSGGSSCERYDVTIFYTAPTAIRACMKWGAEHPGKHDLSSMRLLGTVGEPINPKAWLWYWQVIGGGRLPDRRHLVADRDRRHHDHDAAGRPGREARLGGQAAARDRGRGGRRGRRARSAASRGC